MRLYHTLERIWTMQVLIDDNLTNIIDNEFIDELQSQICKFFNCLESKHRYYSAILPIAVEMYYYDADTIYVEESYIDYEEIFGKYKRRNGGRL